MNDLMSLLPWVLPPLLGAVIGYVTNSLAIRMLFRPLREWRIFGLRVPFTPGIIPRRRHELAESIGRMVSTQLLTAEVLRRRVENESFLVALKRIFGSGLERFGALSLADIEETWRLSYVVKRILTFIFSGDRESKVVDFAVSLLKREETAEAVGRVLLSVKPFQDDKKVVELLDKLYDPLIEVVIRIMKRAGFRRELNRHGRAVLQFAVDQLSSFQRFMISAGQYDRQLELRMPIIVDRTIDEISVTLRSPRTRKNILAFVSKACREHEDDTLSSLLTRFLPEEGTSRLYRFISHIINRFLPVVKSFLEEEDTLSRLIERLEGEIHQRMVVDPEKTVGDLVDISSIVGAQSLTVVADMSRHVILRGVEPFFEQLNLHETVVERIDGLDVDQVESLLLGIIRRHLRWINVFGALLGALIGGIQVLLAALNIY